MINKSRDHSSQVVFCFSDQHVTSLIIRGFTTDMLWLQRGQAKVLSIISDHIKV